MPDWAKDFIWYLYSTASHRTAFLYTSHIMTFLRWYHWTHKLGHSPDEDISRRDFLGLNTWTISSDAVLKLTQKDVRDFIAFCQDRLKHRQATVMARFSALRALLDYYITHDLDGVCLRSNVAADIHFSSNDTEATGEVVSYLDPSQIAALLDSVSGKDATRDLCMLKFLLSTGVTVSELAAMNIYDVSPQSGHPFTVGGKGGRTLYMSNELYNAYTEWLHDRKLLIHKIKSEEKYRPDQVALFLNTKQGQRLTARRIQQIVTKYVSESGVDVKASPQILRNSFVMLLLRSGTSVDSIQEILGHESRRVTEQYLRQLQKSDAGSAAVMMSFSLPK